ncbi:MAG: LicD family protein [Lachnospiraceae bacterium]|nr:LicD family protein [Lachnospiraceae bacterium]
MIRYEIGEVFLQDEERAGFMVSSLMKRCWAAQLKVVAEFAEVCSRHGLKWYAFCGTLLGAVRHKGFIPWDDDIDIAMMRSDYNLFLHYAEKEMPGYIIENYDSYTPEENRFFNFQGITRINNTYTADFNEDYLNEHYGFPYTVGIDLYPLDYVPRDPEEYETNKTIFGYTVLTGYKYKSLHWEGYEKPDAEYEDIDLDEAYQAIYNATGVKIDGDGDVLKQLNDIAVGISSYTKSKDSDMVACMTHTGFGHSKMVFPKSAFRNSFEVPFEMGNIYIPSDPDTVLKINYGSGYMRPNPHSPHDYPYYKMEERWVRNYVLSDPMMARYMPRYYIQDVYNEDPAKKILLDVIYERIK